MGLVFLQANDGHAATRSFDVVASQGLPVPFYAEMRGRKQDQAVKCELSRDRVRLIFLSSYDKKGNPAPPSKPAGEDGLGDMVMEPSAPRQQGFDSLDLTLSEIKKVETDKGLLKLKLAQQEIYLSPIYLPSFTPVEGPQARRFANNYTRLFVRYPGTGGFQAGNRRHERRREVQDGIQHCQRQHGYRDVGLRRDWGDLKCAGRDLHHADHSSRDGFTKCQLCDLGEKRGGPAATSGREVVQGDSHPAGEFGFCARNKVAG